MRGGYQYGGPLVKKALSRAAGLSLWYLARVGTHDATNGFKAYDAKFLKRVVIESRDGFEMGIEMVAKKQPASTPGLLRPRLSGGTALRGSRISGLREMGTPVPALVVVCVRAACYGVAMSDIAVMTTACWRPYYLERTLGSWAAARGVEKVKRFVIGVGDSPRRDEALDVITKFRATVPGEVQVLLDNGKVGPWRAIANTWKRSVLRP